MRAFGRIALILSLGLLLASIPYVEYRSSYAHAKRLREVTPAVLYRSGELTAAGFKDAIERTRVRAIINCQNEYPDPALPLTYWNRQRIAESRLCQDLGVKYIHLDPDLRTNRADPTARPRVIDEFLRVMDDPGNRPALLHCKAGLHRTGLLAAIYRMEYEGWDALAAVTELKDHGFGDSACTAANDYVQQYVLNYMPRRARASLPASGSAMLGNSVSRP